MDFEIMSDVNDLEDSQKRGNGRKVLLILAVIFVLPFTIAALLHALDIRPSGKSFGHLITPPVSLTIPAMQDAFGNTFAATNWQKKWNIVMIIGKCRYRRIVSGCSTNRANTATS